MMNKAHEALLMEYAAGSLDCAHSVLTASYLTLSPEGRRYVAECEVLAAALMEQACECAEMSNTCLDAVLAKIDCTAADCAETEDCIESCVQNCAIIPQPLARVLPRQGKQAKWRRAFGGMEWLDLDFNDRGARARLVRCNPGFTLPHHVHKGPEITLVLDGALEDETGRYVRGALIILDEDTGHEPRADAADGCVIMTITEQPIRFTGFLTRFLNPLT